MLFAPEPIRRRRAEIARECRAGTITEAEAGTRLIDACPDFGGGYILLGNGQFSTGNLAGAEASYWNALERMPCDYSAYFSVSEVRRKQHGESDTLSRRLMVLGIWKLALHHEIPDEVAGFVDNRMNKLDIDFKDPATYEALATALSEADAPAEIPDRLLPYELWNSFERQCAEGMDAGLLRDTLAYSARSIPLWRAAVREWAEQRSALPREALCLVLALLGETAGPAILDDLLDLVDFDERAVFLHANWAVWRIGQRFPAETLEKFRAAATAAPVTLRCALADQMDLLPETPGIEAGLVELLEGFAGFARQEGAAYLLAMVMNALNELARDEEADRVFREFHGFLPPDESEWVRKRADEGLVSELIDEEIDGITIEDICLDGVLMNDEEAEEEDQEEEETVEPFVAPVRPGRNEPCWCGSGKKYKKCHLSADEESDRSEDTRAAKTPAAEPLHERLHRELIRADQEWRGKTALKEAALLYFGRSLEDLGPQPDDALLGGFFEWYLHDFRPASTGRTLMEEYLRKRAGGMTAAERELLEAWREARFGIWEVQRIEEGTGVELKDLFAGDRLFVHDVSCSRSMVQWDCVLSRVYRSEGRWHLAGVGISVPRTLLPKLTEQVEQESRAAGTSAAEFVRANSHRWHQAAQELAEEQFAGLRVVNAEGDELAFCAAEYRVQDEARLIAALKKAKTFETEKSGDAGVRSFAWLEQRIKGPRRSYGHIEIRDGKLRLECNSRERLEIGRQLVEKHGGDCLRHTGDSFESLDRLKRTVFEGRPRRRENLESSLPPEIERDVVSKWKTEHYAHWVDEHLPALGGRTPREAARSESGRPALEDLLRMMENGEERARQEGHAAFDFLAVRKSLGM